MQDSLLEGDLSQRK